MLQVHVSWTYILSRILPVASEEVREHILNNVIQNIQLLTTSSFKNQKRPSRENIDGTSKAEQEHGKAKDALKLAKKKGYRTMLERCKDDETNREIVTEQGLDEDDIRKRDEEAKLDRVPCTTATEIQWVETTYFLKINCDGAWGFRKKTVYTFIVKKQ